jgi:cellulose 1,4-beta-cellobiosidase
MTTSGGTLEQKLVSTCGGNKIVGSRLYLLDSSGSKSGLINPIGNQITYTVDMSQRTYGTNAALYTVEMPASGDTNDAAFGTGYCDADFVGGEGCAEFDIQEANSQAMVYTSHPCSA